MASIPVWAVGQVLSASDVNSWFVPIVASKPADTARANTTSVTNDPDLQITLAANAMYDVTVVAHYKGGTNGSSDGQATINAPSGATGFWLFHRIQITSLAIGYDDAAFAAIKNLGTNGTGNTMPLHIKASVTTTSAGTLAFAWAQNTSNATATTFLTGSFISAQRIG